jgi:hypothetical protein
MTQSHTPGPWSCDGAETETHACRVFGPNGWLLATTFGEIFNYSNEEAEANARLIAAAPDLLEKSEKLYATLMFKDFLKTHPEINNAMIELNAAIAKAGGNQ